MQIFRTPLEMRESARSESSFPSTNRPPLRVLVPTMGALHEGHLSLIRLARKHAGKAGSVGVSIFVNPLQFDRPGDLASYPQPLTADLAACQAAGVDWAFTPNPATMYAPDHSVSITESRLSSGLCGATRPGHFDGVCTVVLKLFHLTSCDAAVFGEKDFQQLAIIRRMVRDLDCPVKIIAGPTLREPDGLAMSSRNLRLCPENRSRAPAIRRGLLATREAAARGIRDADALLAIARAALATAEITQLDYLALVDAETLDPLEHLDSRPAIVALAAFLGEVRLIDHITLADSHRNRCDA